MWSNKSSIDGCPRGFQLAPFEACRTITIFVWTQSHRQRATSENRFQEVDWLGQRVGEFSVLLNTIKLPSHLYSYQLGGGAFIFVLKRGSFLFVGFCFFFFLLLLLGELGLRRCFALGFVFPSVLGIKLGALHMLGRRSPRELWPKPCLFQVLSKYSTVWTLRSCGRLLRSAGIAGVATTPIRGGVFSGCALQQRGAPRPSLATRNSSSFFLIGEET